MVWFHPDDFMFCSVTRLDGGILAACVIANWYQRWVDALPDVSAAWGS
jgi:hypothetical protein